MKAWEWLFTSSALLLALLLLRRLLWGKISRRLQYGLWLVAVLRLLFPFSLPAVSSVANLAQAKPVRQVISGQAVRVRPESPVPSAISKAGSPPIQEQAGEALPLPFIIWAAGSAAVGGWLLYVNLSFAGRLKRQRRPAAAECPLPVYWVDGLSSPCLFGVVHPAVYLTGEAGLSPEVFRHTLVHECCHYRQRDHLWSLIRALCLALHWFNPLVWAAAACSRTDCELACDERTIAVLGEGQRMAYGKTLLSLTQARRPFSLPGCTATTMALKGSSLKRRILLIANAKKPALSGLVLAAAGLLVLIGCTFTGEKLSPEEAVRQLRDSAVYMDGSVYFTVPAGYPDGEDWNIQIHGRVMAGEDSMSIHFFERVNAGHSWKPGGEYQIDLSHAQYRELEMDISLYSGGQAEQLDLLALESGEEAEVYRTFIVSFPAYEDEAMQQNSLVAQTDPFHAVMALPGSWQVEAPENTAPGAGPLYTAMDMIEETADGKRRIASIGFNRYTPYEDADALPPEEIYKTVYYDLRLGRVESWDPYTPVRTDEEGESGIAEVFYVDAGYLQAHPKASMAAAPLLETKGVLCYHSELAAYVGIRFEPDSGVSDAQLKAIAESLRLEREG